MQELYNHLPEKNRRLYAGVEALKLPYGGISYIAELFNCSRDTIRIGIKELPVKKKWLKAASEKKGWSKTCDRKGT